MSASAADWHIDVVDAVLQRWNEAFEHRDTAAMAALFAPGAVYLLPNLPAWVGSEAIHKCMQTMATTLPPGGLRILFKRYNVSSSGDSITFWAQGEHQCQQDGQWTTMFDANALWVLRQTGPAAWQVAYLAVVPLQEIQHSLTQVHSSLTQAAGQAAAQ